MVFGAERQVRDEVAVHDVEVDAVGAGLLDAPDGVAEVATGRRRGCSRRSRARPVGPSRLRPRTADRRTGSWLRSPRRAAALSAIEPLAPARDGGRRRLPGPLRRELAARRADLLAAVAPDRRLDAGLRERRREAPR